MKKTGIMIAAAVVAFAACGKGSLAKDFGALFDDTAKDLNAAAADIKGAKDGATVAAALDKVYDVMVAMKAKGAELEKKHGMRAKGEMPPELKAKNEAFQAAVKNVFSGETQTVMQKYAGDPKVLESLNKIKSLRGS